LIAFLKNNSFFPFSLQIISIIVSTVDFSEREKSIVKIFKVRSQRAAARTGTRVLRLFCRFRAQFRPKKGVFSIDFQNY
jgi:hypothetical protein